MLQFFELEAQAQEDELIAITLSLSRATCYAFSLAHYPLFISPGR